MSGSHGSFKRDGSRGGEEPRRQPRRTASRTEKREGGDQRLDDSGTQAQGRRHGRAEESQQDHVQGHPQDASDDARPILHGVLIKASSLEADNMQKQTQTHAEKVRQEGCGHKRGPPFVWAYMGLVKSLQQSGNGSKGIATYWARLEPLSPTQNMRRGAILQAGQNVRSRHQKNHAEHRVFGETAPRSSRSTRSNRGRAQVRTGSAHSHGRRVTDVSGRSSEDAKIMVKAFFAEKGVQANSKAWYNAMQSEHAQRTEGFWAGRSFALEPLVKRANDTLMVSRDGPFARTWALGFFWRLALICGAGLARRISRTLGGDEHVRDASQHADFKLMRSAD